MAITGASPGTLRTSAAAVNVNLIGALASEQPQAVAIQGDYAYVADYGAGLEIYEFIVP